MNVELANRRQISAFGRIIAILEKNLRYLEAVNMPSEDVKAYRKIIGYLKRKDESEILLIMEAAQRREKIERFSLDPEMTDASIRELTGNDIAEILSSSPVTRRFLERLASVRFGVSTGALSALRSRDALIDKINTMVSHEETHDAIARAIDSGKKPIS